MRIIHICLCVNAYTDDWSYQDNYLPRYHKKAGHQVTVVTIPFAYQLQKREFVTPGTYFDDFGVKVYRLPLFFCNKSKIASKLKIFKGLYKTLGNEDPDIIFVHGCQFLDIRKIIKYITKNPTVRVYVDNHADFSNSASNWLSKNILHGLVWKYCAQSIEPYAEKFYGVLPARVDFLAYVYKLPKNKIELLVMGADDELVVAARQPQIRQSIRAKYNINENDFLIMTGGKIDPAKKQTILLMQAIKRINRDKVKLIVFGSVTPDLITAVESSCYGNRIQYIGWVQSDESYAHFAAADLVVFPGRHSVFWEQVAGLGIPMIVKYWEGTTHVDVGGNCDFLYEDSVNEIKNKIQALIDDPAKYRKMKEIALKQGMEVFSYRSIAERSIMEARKLRAGQI